MIALLGLLGCATVAPYTVNSLSSVAPGGSASEFYALVRAEHHTGGDGYSMVDHVDRDDVILIRCVSSETTDARDTTCARVLTSDQAFAAASKVEPETFSVSKTLSAAETAQLLRLRTIASATALIGARELLITSGNLSGEQAATVRAAAQKDACAMIAKVTAEPCDAVLRAGK